MSGSEIDGQQRLASITILLAAIRDYLFEHQEDMLTNDIKATFLYGVLVEMEKKTTIRLSKIDLLSTTLSFSQKRPG